MTRLQRIMTETVRSFERCDGCNDARRTASCDTSVLSTASTSEALLASMTIVCAGGCARSSVRAASTGAFWRLHRVRARLVPSWILSHTGRGGVDPLARAATGTTVRAPPYAGEVGLRPTTGEHGPCSPSIRRQCSVRVRLGWQGATGDRQSLVPLR